MRFLVIAFASDEMSEASWSSEYYSDTTLRAQDVADHLASESASLYPTQVLVVRDDKIVLHATQMNGDFESQNPID